MVGFHHSHVLDIERPGTPCCDSSVFWVDRPGLTPRTLLITFWLCSPWLNPSRFLNWSILLAVSWCSPGSREVQISIHHFVSQSGCSRILDLVYTAFITLPRKAESGLSCGIVCPECTFPPDHTACLMSPGSQWSLHCKQMLNPRRRDGGNVLHLLYLQTLEQHPFISLTRRIINWYLLNPSVTGALPHSIRDSRGWS